MHCALLEKVLRKLETEEREGWLAVTSLLRDTWQPGVPIGPKITSYPSSCITHSPPSLR